MTMIEHGRILCVSTVIVQDQSQNASTDLKKNEDMMSIYPLVFKPILVPKVWGGQKIEMLGRANPTADTTPIGESWEIVDLPEVCSIVANGPLAGKTLHEVINLYPDAFIGKDAAFSSGEHDKKVEHSFPLLIKYLDARENLSVQVHPDEKYVEDHPDVQLKSEAWYILESDSDGLIYKGFRDEMLLDQIESHITDGTLVEDLQAVKAKSGTLHYLPSGTCHALGAGVFVAEIQTPSDVTFRMYDWDRGDRTLHIEESLECVDTGPIDVTAYEQKTHMGNVFTMVTRLCKCEHFSIEKVRMCEGYQQEIPYDAPSIWMVLEGAGVISNTPAGVDVSFTKGDVLLIPAGMDNAQVTLNSDTSWLDIQFPADTLDNGWIIGDDRLA